jgi:type IV pilus assembly protein PilC
MKFNYQARTKTGQIQSGVIEAVSRESALNILKANNLFVTFLEEVFPPFYARRIKLFEKISKKEIVSFSRQLAIMFKSEIPLIEILNTLAKQTKNPLMREKIFDMAEKVEGGISLSKAFSLYPEIFSSFYVNMVKAGEVSGKLSDVFSYLADYLEKDYDFNRKVMGALTYPIFLLFVFVIVMALIILIVIPQLMPLLTQAGGQIPVTTKALIGFSLFLRKWGWLLVLALFGFSGVAYFYLKTKEGKAFSDSILLRLPLLGNFLGNIYLARFALNLSTMISGGIPIAQALEITSKVVGNEVYRSIILETSEGVKRGEPVSRILEKYPREFSPLFVQMLVVGERTGRLESALKNSVDFYQKEVDTGLDKFMRLLEPVLIVVFGILVGGLMAAVISPVYKIVGGG